jgi:Na+/H+-translocating membrane pyrophosphatase
VQVFAGLLIGAMLPYWFSSMTMKSVGKAALAMVEEVRQQFNTIAGLMEGTARPDYKRCVEISTKVRPRPAICLARMQLLQQCMLVCCGGHQQQVRVVATYANMLASVPVANPSRSPACIMRRRPWRR